ncbi:EscU/YscU/HrcU family type III secretion system export apparatus switch protein [Salinimonas chungwhensis]|uniref:EscU/YscU/HrcU family type III secretion system export apparatus switch protein n=1 Tax=Salinimonas chungwhensis TaxID=265425 RepID=UPI00037B31A5|nr:EscU/YscU/HrcU family type III secretion system export apparatus switch protein [Salinimonas chungwhensis]
MKKSFRSAVGLKYNGSTKSETPKVIAKGHGDLAEEIVRLAQDHGILIHEDPALMEVLSQLDIGQDIPEAMYYTIAELIAYAYVLQGKVPQSWASSLPHISDRV